ncbi:MAG: hypothetical protein Q8Q39_04120 [bacterium]|nr:hypothetical protein [bacterium]
MEREDAFNMIAATLRIPAGDLYALDEKMARATGKGTVIEDIAAENEKRVLLIRNMFGLYKHATAEQAYGVLLDALRQSDAELYELFRKPDGTSIEGLRSLFNFAHEFAEPPKGFFMKPEKARELLYRCPPQKILTALGYGTVQELLAAESLYEVYAALRVVEGSDWLNEVFFKGYENLTPQDFEMRQITMTVLGGKWLDVAKKFQQKKYHNVSHLKELGVIFVIPDRIDTPGETMRLFGLLSHYVHEVSFYAQLIKMYANRPDFARRLISLFRGDIPDVAKSRQEKGAAWLIVQRYLAKDDERHPLLFVPHINPEAMHWRKAERDIARLNDRFPFVNVGFWYNLDFVGSFFKGEGDSQAKLISFDLLDNIMSLVMEKHMVKYLYHQQEALWNKLFMEYMGGEEVMEKMIVENFESQAIII